MNKILAGLVTALLLLGIAGFAGATPLSLNYSVTDLSGGYYEYKFELILDNNDGSWVAGQGWNWFIFGDQVRYSSPLTDFVGFESDFPVGPWTYYLTTQGVHNGPTFGDYRLSWIPTSIGETLSWSGISTAYLAQGELLFSTLGSRNGAVMADFETANLVAGSAFVPEPATMYLRHAGKSSIFFYDVEVPDGNGYGRFVINTDKHTFNFIGKDFTPNQHVDLKTETDSGFELIDRGKSTKSGNLHISGTWERTLPGVGAVLGSIEPRHKYIAAGSAWSLAVTCDGEVYVWGYNSDCEKVAYPILLEELWPNAVEVDGGQFHNLALMSDGTVWAWGKNDHGQLGNHSNDDSCTPLLVYGPAPAGYLTGIIKVAAGANHSLALKSDGTVWAWGKNYSGQLGIFSNDDQLVPNQVHGPGNEGYLTDVVDVAAGGDHSLALKRDGTVYAWGEGGDGQLGIGPVPIVPPVPNQVHGPGNVGYLSGIIKVAAGPNFSLAVKEDGSLWAWGSNDNGQLGIHSDNDQLVPNQVHGPGNEGYLIDVVDVAAGGDHTLALKRDGTVYAWGLDGDGQLGIGPVLIGPTVPNQVHGPNDEGYLTGIIEVAAGYYHSLALMSDGTVWAWGSNYSGQLGIHSGDDQLVPIQVHGLDNDGYLTGIGTCTPPTDTP